MDPAGRFGLVVVTMPKKIASYPGSQRVVLLSRVTQGILCVVLLWVWALSGAPAAAAPSRVRAKAPAAAPAKAPPKARAKAPPRVRAKAPAAASSRVRAKAPARTRAKAPAKVGVGPQARSGSKARARAGAKARARARARVQPPAFTSRLPAMSLYHLHNRERLVLRPYDGQGRLRPRALQAFSRFLRCTHTDATRAIHWRLLVVLYDVWLHFGQPQVTVFSGHRPKQVARLKTSQHVIGHAVDFNLNGIDNARVRDYLREHHDQVGVGFYPNSWHVHLDVRPEKSFWIDYGAPGKDAVYSRNPERDLRRGVARRGANPSLAAPGTQAVASSRTARPSGKGPQTHNRGKGAADPPPRPSSARQDKTGAGPNEHASSEDLP